MSVVAGSARSRTTRDALRRLLRRLCASETTAAFLAGLGPSRASEWVVGGLHVEPVHRVGLASLEVRPWDGGAIGVVEVDLAPGTTPTRTQLERWLGPFRSTVGPDEAGEVWVAHWWEDPLPVEAVVHVAGPDDPDAPVTRLSIRRGRSRPGTASDGAG